MGEAAAKQGDRVIGTDVHVVLVPSSGGPVPTPMSLPFTATITERCSPDVSIEGKAAAVAGSGTANQPPHVAPTGRFAREPANRGRVLLGSATVFVNGKPAARAGDRVLTCNDPADAPSGVVQATSTVLIGR
ncbi:PAAR domain-containing protein [Actinophytocola sp. KF-1]